VLDPTIAGWAATLGLIAALVAFDLWRSWRNPHPIGIGEASAWSIFYVAVAVLFGVAFALVAGSDFGAQYFAGYIVEKSLSVDNLFVFVLIMSTFAVPAEQQARLLMIGIVGALILRTIFIALGAAMLEAFALTYLLFGACLMATAVQLFRHRDEDPSFRNTIVAAASRRGLRPALLALIAIGTTDLLFAFDSIPAVFGVTQHAYIVFAANAFALLGLRALFFLVSGLLSRLVYLSTGLAVILAFIGLKLVLHFAHLHQDAVPEISTGLSLGVIGTVLTGTTIASLVRGRRDPTARAHAGSLRQPTEDRASAARPDEAILSGAAEPRVMRPDQDEATTTRGSRHAVSPRPVSLHARGRGWRRPPEQATPPSLPR
jgi:tellurite resistance protein TerC